MWLHRRACLAGMGLLLWEWTGRLWGDGRRCQQCGLREGATVCRLVREEKKVTVTCWGMLEEEFCLPGPSQRGCQHADQICTECAEPQEVSSRPRLFVWSEWQPWGRPEVLTRRKLMKRTETRTIPSYHWELQELCEPCQVGLQPLQVSAESVIPPLPKWGKTVRVVGAEVAPEALSGAVILPAAVR